MANKTKAQLAAELKAAKAELAVMRAYRNVPSKGTKKVKFAQKNSAGVTCSSKFTLSRSNKKIARHLNGECGCNVSMGFTCWLVKRDANFTNANKGMGKAAARRAGFLS